MSYCAVQLLQVSIHRLRKGKKKWKVNQKNCEASVRLHLSPHSTDNQQLEAGESVKGEKNICLQTVLFPATAFTLLPFFSPNSCYKEGLYNRQVAHGEHKHLFQHRKLPTAVVSHTCTAREKHLHGSRTTQVWLTNDTSVARSPSVSVSKIK